MLTQNSQPSLQQPQQLRTINDHLRAWGLRHIPFSLTNKSAHYFDAPSYSQAIEHLNCCVTTRSVMLLTADPGSGKSTLIKTWIKRLDSKCYLPVLITQASLSASGMLEMLIAQLGKSPKLKRSSNLITFQKCLSELSPLTLCIILDDAHNYPSSALEEIRMLLGLGGEITNAFALILLSEDYLLRSLRMNAGRALYSRIAIYHKLVPLCADQVAAYLNWHIQQAGLNREVFSPAAIQLIAEASRGNPRTINLLAYASWLAAASQGHDQITIEPEHVNIALHQVPSASDTITLS
jgi:type II secretory pathway predicted ATPase ExeA